MDAQDDVQELKTNHTVLAISLAVLASLLRLFPHPWNFAPMGAIGLFAGARLKGWVTFVVPVGLCLFSDLVLWQRNAEYSPLQPFSYLSYALCVLLGKKLIRSSSVWRILGAGVLSSVIFFLVTNFGSWVQWTHLYPRTLAGLLECYGKGFEFYRGTFFGDLIYTPVLFGIHGLVTYMADKVERRSASPVDTETQS
jgi:hypothetical protein